MDPQDLDTFIRLLIGVTVLLVGRNIFWLFIGLAGFLVGMEIANIWLTDQPGWPAFAVGACMGLAGAIVAILYERVAFSVAGFYASAYLAVSISNQLEQTAIHPLVFFVAGLAGAVLCALVMDVAIIGLSSLVGAAAIVSTMNLSIGMELVVLIILVTIGFTVQHRVLSRRRTT